jgi:hypothetical protein
LINHHEFRVQLDLPSLTPDMIDDFVSWLTEAGYKMPAFQTAERAFKRDLFKQFWKQYPAEKKQLKMDLPPF